jgi:hypothetical protein
MRISTLQPKFKAQRILNPVSLPMPGCIYSGDSGNSEWHTGMLVQVDGSDATIVDARGKEHVVILSTLRSIQVTR